MCVKITINVRLKNCAINTIKEIHHLTAPVHNKPRTCWLNNHTNYIFKLDVLRQCNLHQGSCNVAEKHSGALLQVLSCCFCNVMRNGKPILDPHPQSDQRQNLTTSRGSWPVAHVYHVWSTTVNFICEWRCSQTKWLTNCTDHITAGLVAAPCNVAQDEVCHLFYSCV